MQNLSDSIIDLANEIELICMVQIKNIASSQKAFVNILEIAGKIKKRSYQNALQREEKG